MILNRSLADAASTRKEQGDGDGRRGDMGVTTEERASSTRNGFRPPGERVVALMCGGVVPVDGNV